MRAAVAHRLACEGTALLWRGDFHNARQLLSAMGRRVGRSAPGGQDAPSDPPWVPAKPASDPDLGVHDAGGGMLRGFLSGLAGRLEPGGEGWLVLSDLAERLGLRGREELVDAVAEAGLRVVGRLDTRPRHARVRDTGDLLHAARAAEVTSLWRLAAA